MATNLEICRLKLSYASMLHKTNKLIRRTTILPVKTKNNNEDKMTDGDAASIISSHCECPEKQTTNESLEANEKKEDDAKKTEDAFKKKNNASKQSKKKDKFKNKGDEIIWKSVTDNNTKSKYQNIKCAKEKNTNDSVASAIKMTGEDCCVCCDLLVDYLVEIGRFVQYPTGNTKLTEIMCAILKLTYCLSEDCVRFIKRLLNCIFKSE